MQPWPRLSFKVLCQLTLEMLKSEEFLIECGGALKTTIALVWEVTDVHRHL